MRITLVTFDIDLITFYATLVDFENNSTEI